ncbi:DUF1861 domain-containing protein [Photobacterium gaetbulicola]|uniref:DUF1861 family protein n=1 Tax=Photobacterium gaetbulicola Gung47 TaxID=658445 RepID=A0A0C5X2A1_9GAMM|nr:DUF1861 family protein [Photobacterium gaetbulicola]AJR09470.1 hypothetical protein H744_2c2817 [Photobacterium gaetbulicola Gung47]PSU14268.1 DUF1861 domain-containing protein [Photobacterium gaetbulicola]
MTHTKQLTASKISVSERYAEFVENKPHSAKTEKLLFSGVGSKDVYNISAPFVFDGHTLIAGRIEDRDSEHSIAGFFHKVDGHWVLLEGAPTFVLQDPFVTFIDQELVFGGVEIAPHPENPQALTWKTVFYRGTALDNLTRFAEGPEGMKDIRLCEIEPNRIAVFTRPQGEVGGRGTIGYTEIDQLSNLTPTTINQAKLLTEQFEEHDWGGANEAHHLGNGIIGVLSHVAMFDDKGDRHYYPSVFTYNSKNHTYSDLKIIAERDLFTPGAAKRPDLIDVVFSGGLYGDLTDSKLKLFAGISDAEAHWLEINNPFL